MEEASCLEDIVKAKPAERMMDNWAVGKLIDWAAGKNGNDEDEGDAQG